LNNPHAKIAIFLLLTFGLSACLWVPIIRSGDLNIGGGMYVLALMWCPGIAAIATRLITQRNLRGQGWGLGRIKSLAIAYSLPLAYAAPVYLLVWAIGIEGFDPASWGSDGQSPLTGLALLFSLGVLMSLVSATGEEIGWRGLLVPELDKLTGFRNLSLISGVIWGLWHTPLILFANYRGEGTSTLYSLICFLVMIVGLSAIMAWLRLTSGSLWPAAMLHATHNLFVQGVFDGATVNGGPPDYWVSEFGAGLALTIGVAAYLLTRRYSPSASTS
jgi:membrane protease YdiL (CAAX protease family)